MKVTIPKLESIVGVMTAGQRSNAASVLEALDVYSAKMGLNQPHRLAQFFAQIIHESGKFRYDKEVWGKNPTPAQERYDTRTDLGNTPEKDGDGYKYRGRTSIQITGAANVRAFRDWCRKIIGGKVPDFLQSPELMNTNPWEGLAPLWFWDTRKLNTYADQGDIEMITKRINGGLNGYDDRLNYLLKVSLVLLGYPASGIMMFQKDAGLIADGISGPRTRGALHKALLNLTPKENVSSKAQAAPVVEVAVPEELDKPLTHTGGFWERVTQIGGLLGTTGVAAFLQDWRVVVVLLFGLTGVALIGLLLHKRIIDAVKSIKSEVNQT